MWVNGGMIIRRAKLKKPGLMPLCPPWISHSHAWLRPSPCDEKYIRLPELQNSLIHTFCMKDKIYNTWYWQCDLLSQNTQHPLYCQVIRYGSALHHEECPRAFCSSVQCPPTPNCHCRWRLIQISLPFFSLHAFENITAQQVRLVFKHWHPINTFLELCHTSY